MRKCIACGESFSKKELLRVVFNKEEGILVDHTGKKNGRGAYLCNKSECIEKAKKTKALNRALGMPIDEHIYEEILSYVND